MKIRFTADSTCDMSADFIERYQVTTIPLGIEMDGRLYKDGVDLTPDEIITAVHRGANLPRTSAINIVEYQSFFQDQLKDCDAVMHFCIASEMSSCYQNACLAAEGLPVWCVDSRNLSSGIAACITEAADAAAAGLEPEAIMKQLKTFFPKVDVSFIIDRLDFLYKGGRCSMVSMLGANVLHLRPCIEVNDGKMGVGKKYRGTYERSLRQYIADRLKNPERFSTRRVFLVHTGISDAALESIRGMVTDALPFKEVYTVRAGATITSHCGENTFGLMLIRK